MLLTPQSETVPLPALLRSYRPLTPLSPSPSLLETSPQTTQTPDASLFYGRLYLPQSQLEGLIVKRISPALQLQFSAVSSQYLRNGGTALGLAQYDVGRYALEGLASSDGGLLGLRGVYNFGGDAESISSAVVNSSETTSHGNGNGNGNGDKERIYGRFSTGGEIYYGTLNKSGGISLGGRFATLPSHRGTPLSATLTLNPLMGNIAASYAVVAGRYCSLATRMEFNVFSYESAWAVGMELWRKPLARRAGVEDEFSAYKRRRSERSFRAKMEWRLDTAKEMESLGLLNNMMVPVTESSEENGKQSQAVRADEEEYAGVLKARVDQNLRIGVLWEGRVKSLLFSLGSAIDLRQLDKPFRTMGLEVQFSS